MNKTQLRKGLARVVPKAMDKFQIPGVAVGILHEGDELAVGLGVTNIDYPQQVDEETLFLIGSTTKTYTGTLLMRLVDQGKLDLDATVSTYLPKFRLQDEDVTRRATVRHLVTHTGGWLGDYFDDLGRGDDALRRIVARMAKKTPQLTPLGEVWSYNNSGFYVAGRIIETIMRKPYETVARELLLDPLGMDKSFFFADEAITYKVANGHRRTLDGGLTVSRPWHLGRTVSPAGGINSTVSDQLKYARFHLGDGTAPDGTRILSKKSLRQMREPQAPAGSMAEKVGITWLLETIGGTRIAKHGGTTTGQMSEFVLAPDRDFAVTVLTNGELGHQLGGVVVDWTLEQVLGVKRDEVKPKKISKKALESCVGQYISNPMTYNIRVEDGGWVVEMEADPKVLEERPEVALAVQPPMRIAPTASDRGVIIDPPLVGRRVEFIEGGSGDVEWVRWGGRIVRRKADS